MAGEDLTRNLGRIYRKSERSLPTPRRRPGPRQTPSQRPGTDPLDHLRTSPTSFRTPPAGIPVARRYVSIKEVAAAAGVSFQTASKVLNGGAVRVSAETAARITEVAKE